MSADAQLAAYVDRVLRMKEEADGIAEDIKAIYGEAKAEGYDKTQLGNLVTYLRKRAKDKDGEAEKEAVFDLYLSAYMRAKGEVGTVRATRAHAPDDEITEPQVAPQPAQAAHHDEANADGILIVLPEGIARQGVHPARGELGAAISTPIQPETEVPYVPLPVVVGPNMGVAEQITEGLKEALAVAKGEAEPAAVHVFPSKPLRPYCLNPGTKCGGQGKKHCGKCEQAHQQAQAAGVA